MISAKRVRKVHLTTATLAAFTVLGCGGPSPPSRPDVLPTYASFEELKPRLERVARTGEGGSSLMDIEAGLRMLSKVDAAKSERLLQQFRELELAPEPERRQEIAREMLDQL